MSTVALIGPDGAGKTTVARRLTAEDELDARYLYMGVSVGSSNVTLPTTRLARRVKALLAAPGDARDEEGESGSAGERGSDDAAPAPTGLRKGRLWASARLLNRLAEEWYRQLLARYHEMRGRVVIFDRHYVFDFRGADIAHRNRSLSKRVHQWLLDRAYPRPDLVLCLDAPGEVLYERKGEKSPEALEARRQAFLRQGREMEEFVVVDATRSPEEVYAQVLRHVRSVAEGARARRGPSVPPGERGGAPGAGKP